MKTAIGGDRLGSGNKQNISLKTYNRSTHDLSYLWRSSMASGTLVPFMNIVGLPGDSFDIDLNCEVMTLPTIGPLFGSYKVQLDVFQIPIRLYNASLHMNKLGIGMDMSSVMLPQMTVPARGLGKYTLADGFTNPNADNAQVNPSALIKYLGVSGIGALPPEVESAQRHFNGVPLLGYWDIYKNYYANKQEEKGVGIHMDTQSVVDRQEILSVIAYQGNTPVANILDDAKNVNTSETASLVFQFGEDALEVDPDNIIILENGTPTQLTIITTTVGWDASSNRLIVGLQDDGTKSYEVPWQTPSFTSIPTDNTYRPKLTEFDLENIDTMRERLLQYNTSSQFYIALEAADLPPYNWIADNVSQEGEIVNFSNEFSQESLAIKTYQSDLFNNWISTEWIDGANGINEVTAVDTTGDSFSIDSLNLATKVYNMLNRIAISGGTYDDWLDAVYTHERARSVESPIYMGSLIKELAFESVISNSESEGQPLGTLAGRGKLTSKNKGGKIKVKVDEPSYIMGIVSLTPRVDYSQGNAWDVNLKTMNDFHKPALDAIGYQDLIAEQMAWQSTEFGGTGSDPVFKTVGKQPAWINYMTAVNKTYGNFADANKEMFMTLNRRYDINPTSGEIMDLTTYIDPTKFNQIFSDTNIDAQNFWVQISNDITARRKMSAKVIPNL